MYDPLDNNNINKTDENTKKENTAGTAADVSEENKEYRQDYKNMSAENDGEKSSEAFQQEPQAENQFKQETYSGAATQSNQQNGSYAGQQTYSGSYYTPGNSTYNHPSGFTNQQPAGQNSGQYQWNGTAYHYAQPPKQASPQPPKKQPDPSRKKGRGGKIALKVIACVLACLVVSGASIGGVIALANAGYITIGGVSSGMDINGKADSSAAEQENNHSAGSENGIVNPSSNTQTSGLTRQQVAAKVIPSVVCIQNYQDTSYFMGAATQQQQDSEVSPSSEGSGIIATSDGYIITNAHVVEDADALKVITSDGSTYEAELIGSDAVTDLAVIKIDAEGLTAAEFGSSSDLQVADEVMAVGNPGGLELNSSVTIGYVSALNRMITTSSGYTMSCIQTDAAINPGNSGGALVNMAGQVVGINSSKIVATGYEGLGFSIPIDDAEPIINSLKEYGYVKDRAILGISGQYLDAMTARMYGLTEGMYVADVTNESVKKAGISQGCVITKIDDTDVTSQATITNYVNTKKPGDEVVLEVYNGLTGKSFKAEVTLIETTGN